MELGRDELLNLYYLMILTRGLEDQIRELHRQGRITGAVSTARGHEAVTVGSASALEAGDVIAPLHRDLGAHLARGITPEEILAQWLTRSTALSGGRDGQLHFGEMRDRMVLPMSGLLGASLPVAVGTALGAKLRGEERVTLAYIGDGGTNSGDFHEALNLAATLDLPFVCLIENNSANQATQQSRVKHLADRAAAYGIPGYVVDGGDVLEVYEATRKAAHIARSGRGPALIEAKTVRLHGNSAGDTASNNAADAAETWRKRDPIERFTRYLCNSGALTDDMQAEFAVEVARAVQDALRQVEQAPAPDPADLMAHLYAPDDALPLGPYPREEKTGVTLERAAIWR